MDRESRLILNPRVTVFRHNGGAYLFDPFTRTCASMNEVMLTFFMKPDNAKLLAELSDKDRQGLESIAAQLSKLGILIEAEAATVGDGRPVFDSSGSLTNLAVFVTTKCNLRCTYCYASGGDSGKTISRDIWRPAMDHFFANLGSSPNQGDTNSKSVNLAIHGGGEPTVEFDVLKDIVADFCERARTAKLRPLIGMGTNGTYDEAVQQWILENNISVNISLDGPRDIQNRLRPFRSGQPSYDVVARNLKGLVKAGRRMSVRATITSETLKSMEETVELAEQLGLATLHFEPVSLTGRCATSATTRPDAGKFAEKFLKCFLLGLKLDIDVRYSGLRCFEHRHQRFCAACGQNFCVTPDGIITTCYEVLDSGDPAAGAFFIGHVDPSQKRVVLDHARIAELKQRVAANMQACQGCFLRYQCAGDCPVKGFRYSNGDLYSPDPYRCRIADRINKQLIAWLADGVIESRDVEQTKVISLNQGSI